MQWTGRLLIGVLLIETVWAEEEVTTSDVSVEESSTIPSRSFTFRPEVLKKFRVVLKRIFNFDELFALSEQAQLRSRGTWFSRGGKTNFRSGGDRAAEREMLAETAEIPEPSPTDEYEQKRREYERYWRQYYAQQQQTTYGNWNDNRVQQVYSPYQQQQTYNPYTYNQQYSPYGPRVFQQPQYYGQQWSARSGLNFGTPNMFFNSGMGLSFG